MDDGPRFAVTATRNVVVPLELPDLTRPLAARRFRRVMADVLSMVGDEDDHNESPIPDDGSSTTRGVT